MSCPYINASNPLCSEHLSLQHLEDAFEFCTGRYQLCSLYLRMSQSGLYPVGATVDRDHELAAPVVSV
ncbi:MAG: hypothetical protein JW810_12660 [Sedimentisphaerales bacterium]|nr:hypothetical protein [Sedimentisphaerales bacterium]